MSVLRYVGILMACCVSVAACTSNGPATSTATPTASASGSTAGTTAAPVGTGATGASVIPATVTTASALAKMSLVPLPGTGVPDAVHNLLPVRVTTKVRELAAYGSFASQGELSIAGLVSPVTGKPRTALIRVLGPGLDGRHQVSVGPDGIVTATLTLPVLAPGQYSVAIEDLSQVHPDADGVESGYAILDLAIYDVR